MICHLILNAINLIHGKKHFFTVWVHAGVNKMLSYFCWAPGSIWECRERTLHPCLMAHRWEMNQVTKLKWEGWGGKRSRPSAGARLGICARAPGGHSCWGVELWKDRAPLWQPRRAAAIIKPQCRARGPRGDILGMSWALRMANCKGPADSSSVLIDHPWVTENWTHITRKAGESFGEGGGRGESNHS